MRADLRDGPVVVTYYVHDTGEVCERTTVMQRWRDNGAGNIVPHCDEILKREILRREPYPLGPESEK